MIKTANEINKHMPVLMDSMTRLDNVMYIPENKLQYNYTILIAGKENIDTVALKNAARENILNIIRTNPKSAYFRDNKIDLSASYSDKNGVFIQTVEVSHNEYK